MDGTFRERSQRKYHLIWMGHLGERSSKKIPFNMRWDI